MTVDPEQRVSGPAGAIPPRRPRSVRRTTTIDMTWPDGPAGSLHVHGLARDAVTGDPTRPPTVVATATTWVSIDSDRTIETIRCDPDHPAIGSLVGCRGGGHLRSALDDAMPDERAAGTPLSLLLDDLSGTSLIAGVAWGQWPELRADRPPRRRIALDMEGVCIGFRPGSSALVEVDGPTMTLRSQPVGSLVDPDDPAGWHALPDLPQVSTRRSRFIDVHLDSRLVTIHAGFLDSVGHPDHDRVAIHEYRIHATADLDTMRLRSLEADPRVLPFRECPSAADNCHTLIGVPLSSMRAAVLDRLARTNGCTHLNDALRALADVPALLAHLGVADATD